MQENEVIARKKLPWRIVYSEQVSDDEEFCLYAKDALSEDALSALEEFCARQRIRAANQAPRP